MTIFNANQMQGFTLEISDREIYNDVRSSCDITDILDIRPDATPDLFEWFEIQGDISSLAIGATADVTVTVPEEHSEIAWLKITRYSAAPVTQFGWEEVTCTDLNGVWSEGPGSSPSFCILPTNSKYASVEITDRGATTCTVRVENLSSWYDYSVIFFVSYQALTSDKRYIKLRSIDETSILKYGRRVMDLTWPLGQHPVTMQSMIDTYVARYKDAVSMASMTLEGKDDANVSAILELRMDGKHQFIHPLLEMDEEFFVNHITVSKRRGMVTGTFDLEQVRTMEDLTFFIIGTSLIGGTHVISP